MRHVVSLVDFSRDEIQGIIELGIKMKKHPEAYASTCLHQGLLMLFQKTSTRTLLSFASAIHQLGGYPVTLDWDQSNFAISPIQYEVQYASRNCDVIMARLKYHKDVVDLAHYSQVPVINGCSERYHPCQALADLMTIFEIRGTFSGTTLSYVGVLNNVANSLIEGCMQMGLKLKLVTPIINPASWDQQLMDFAEASDLVQRVSAIEDVIGDTDFVYTDTWVDMEFFNAPNFLAEREARMKTMIPYQINRTTLAGHHPYLMHDMPIHPGYEIEESLVESEESIIYQQAENRMHVEKALLVYLLNQQSAKPVFPCD